MEDSLEDRVKAQEQELQLLENDRLELGAELSELVDYLDRAPNEETTKLLIELNAKTEIAAEADKVIEELKTRLANTRDDR